MHLLGNRRSWRHVPSGRLTVRVKQQRQTSHLGLPRTGPPNVGYSMKMGKHGRRDSVFPPSRLRG